MENKNHEQDLEIVEIKTNLKNLDEKVFNLDKRFSKFMGNDFDHLKVAVEEIKDKLPNWKIITLLVSIIMMLLTTLGFLIK